jgi:hypothetical protein
MAMHEAPGSPKIKYGRKSSSGTREWVGPWNDANGFTPPGVLMYKNCLLYLDDVEVVPEGQIGVTTPATGSADTVTTGTTTHITMPGETAWTTPEASNILFLSGFGSKSGEGGDSDLKSLNGYQRIKGVSNGGKTFELDIDTSSFAGTFDSGTVGIPEESQYKQGRVTATYASLAGTGSAKKRGLDPTVWQVVESGNAQAQTIPNTELKFVGGDKMHVNQTRIVPVISLVVTCRNATAVPLSDMRSLLGLCNNGVFLGEAQGTVLFTGYSLDHTINPDGTLRDMYSLHLAVRECPWEQAWNPKKSPDANGKKYEQFVSCEDDATQYPQADLSPLLINAPVL